MHIPVSGAVYSRVEARTGCTHTTRRQIGSFANTVIKSRVTDVIIFDLSDETIESRFNRPASAAVAGNPTTVNHYQPQILGSCGPCALTYDSR